MNVIANLIFNVAASYQANCPFGYIRFESLLYNAMQTLVTVLRLAPTLEQ